MRHRISLLSVALVLAATTVLAQTQTGTIEGRLVDEQGAVLPGVTVTLTGRQGSQTTVSDARGEYRFVGLTPGVYEVRTELAGFTPRSERDLDLGLGRTLTVNLTLRVGGLSETVQVTAESPLIDVTSTASDNTISQGLLANMPINLGTFNTATALLNYAPGINNQSAFGGDAAYGNALLIDGVDTRDPEGGSAWVFYNFNIIEEVQVAGVGAPAEYGGFSGAVVNTITKSGGNLYSGLFEGRYTGSSLASNNITSDLLEANPALGEAVVLKRLTDYTVQMGGPLSKDKAFWWASVQRYSVQDDPAGLRTLHTEVSPRYNGKLTFVLTPNDTLMGSFQWDNYNQTGRAGFPGATLSTDDQTVRQDSPEAVWNAQYRKVFGSNTFLEAKFTGYWGYYYLDPVDKAPVHADNDTGEYRGGAGYYYYADRDRNQVNVALSQYAQAYGTHSFKFGLEIERSTSHSRSEYSSCGSVNCYFVDYSGVPTYAYSGLNYNVNGRNKRESFYAQDAWKVGRLTANLGLRLDRIRGHSVTLDKEVYTPKLAWNPRLGVVFDVSGKGSSIVKGFWGRYYEGTSLAPYSYSVGGYEDYIYYDVLSDGTLSEYGRDTEQIYRINPDIKHLGLDEATIGFEQQIRRDLRLAVTGIWRKYLNFIAATLPGSTWTPFGYTNPMTNQQMTLYRWANRPSDITGDNYYVTNIDDLQYYDPSGGVIAPADAKRKYEGLMFVLTKNYSNRWQGQFSYVWSRAKGTVGNSSRSGFGWGSTFENPTMAIVNNDGYMENDRTHEFKLMGGYQVPRVDVSINAYFRSISGGTYAAVPSSTVSSRSLNWTSSLRPNLEPRGAERYPTQKVLDIRLEKLFTYDVHRFSVWMDVANLFNASTVTGRQARYPDRTISGNVVAFNGPTTVAPARQVSFGGRWTF